MKFLILISVFIFANNLDLGSALFKLFLVVFDRGCPDQINRGMAERGGLAVYFKPSLRQTHSRESRKHHRQSIGLVMS